MKETLVEQKPTGKKLCFVYVMTIIYMYMYIYDYFFSLEKNQWFRDTTNRRIAVIVQFALDYGSYFSFYIGSHKYNCLYDPFYVSKTALHSCSDYNQQPFRVCAIILSDSGFGLWMKGWLATRSLDFCSLQALILIPFMSEWLFLCGRHRRRQTVCS